MNTGQETCTTNIEKFKSVYNELIEELIKRRKIANLSQADIGFHLDVDRRKIMELEAGNGGVGLALRYAELLDIETQFTIIKH